jgi:UDP-N-acetylglucosamine 2-epimerase (hydrolysing)
MSKKKILFISGTRADFGKLKALIQKVDEAPDLDYEVFVTGMHMLEKYGSTIEELKKAGLRNLYPFINQDSTVNTHMDFILGTTIHGLGHYIRENHPDLMVIHGDRVETLAAAIVGALNNILVAHIEGGEVSGTVDEIIRHATTKLSHLHFVSNESARQRVLQMGERSESVFVIGSPDIDVMLSNDLPVLDQVKQRYEIPFDRYAIFMFHPVTTELETLSEDIESVISGIIDSGRSYVVIYPNNDTGSDKVLNAYQRLRANGRFRLLPSMRFECFLRLLKNADVIVGNSSTGVREAPIYGVPTINIGSRQHRRSNQRSIINISPRREELLQALAELPENVEPSGEFGRGDSARLFMEQIRSPKLWETPRQKIFKDAPTTLTRAEASEL